MKYPLVAATMLQLLVPLFCAADTYVLPPDDVDVIGAIKVVSVDPGSFPVDIAQEYGTGQDEFLWANPGLKRWLPVSPDAPTDVIIPTRYILPSSQRSGVVINLAERRLYYYPDPQVGTLASFVVTYPVSIGQVDWVTPITNATVVRRQANPSWYPPESIKKEAREVGVELPDVVPAGPDNPLGAYAIYLDLPGYLIHGTSNPAGIGMRLTHGCIRLYPEHIASLYKQLPIGTTVEIEHEPVKVGWYAGKLYIEVHKPLAEMRITDSELLDIAMNLVKQALAARPVTTVRSSKIRQAVKNKSGIPVALNSTPVDYR